MPASHTSGTPARRLRIIYIVLLPLLFLLITNEANGQVFAPPGAEGLPVIRQAPFVSTQPADPIPNLPTPSNGQAVNAKTAVLTGNPMGLGECISLALQNQPSIAAANASLGAAHVARRALCNMTFAPLFRLDIPIRRRQSTLGVEVAHAEVVKAQWETRYAVTRNYFTVVYARSQLKVLAEVLDSLGNIRKETKKQVDGGNPDFAQTDLDTLDLTIGMIATKRIEAEHGVEQAMAALREAMAAPPHFDMVVVGDELPPLGESLHKDALVELALSRRSELLQASLVSQVIHLEVCAQSKLRALSAQTFAAGADIHAKQVPQGTSNGEYRPWAVGIEMPTTLVGRKEDRMQRARELGMRAVAVMDKTRNLITLETENAFFKWQQAAREADKLGGLRDKAKKLFTSTQASYDLGKAKVDELIRAQGMKSKIQADFNEALYRHVLALAALERITAGGYTPSYHHSAPIVWSSSTKNTDPPANGNNKGALPGGVPGNGATSSAQWNSPNMQVFNVSAQPQSNYQRPLAGAPTSLPPLQARTANPGQTVDQHFVPGRQIQGHTVYHQPAVEPPMIPVQNHYPR